MLVLRVGDVEIAQVREWEGELFKRGELLPAEFRSPVCVVLSTLFVPVLAHWRPTGKH
jgi:hypothetical protein